MAQLLVRDLEEIVKDKLRERARRHGQSMEAEVRDILRHAVLADDENSSETGLATKIREHFRGLEVDLDDAIRELRSQPARAADFD